MQRCNRCLDSAVVINVALAGADRLCAHCGLQPTVRLKFTSDEDLRSTGDDRKTPGDSGVRLAGQKAAVDLQAGDSTGTRWQATYTLAAGDKEGDLAIEVTAGYTDLAGNLLGETDPGRVSSARRKPIRGFMLFVLKGSSSGCILILHVYLLETLTTLSLRVTCQKRIYTCDDKDNNASQNHAALKVAAY